MIVVIKVNTAIAGDSTIKLIYGIKQLSPLPFTAPLTKQVKSIGQYAMLMHMNTFL